MNINYIIIGLSILLGIISLELWYQNRLKRALEKDKSLKKELEEWTISTFLNVKSEAFFIGIFITFFSMGIIYGSIFLISWLIANFTIIMLWYVLGTIGGLALIIGFFVLNYYWGVRIIKKAERKVKNKRGD